MEIKKLDLSGAKSLIETAKDAVVQVIDQNGDDQFNKEDFSILAEKLGDTTKKTVVQLKETATERGHKLEQKRLQPIFTENLDEASFLMPKVIFITEMDKKRAESEVCKDSIGYIADQKDLQVLCIFRDKIENFGLTFFPDINGDVYYVNPSDKGQYIALDDYFDFLKESRVSELQKIAQDLGAKHFRVTFKEQKTKFAKNMVKANGKAQVTHNNSSLEAEHELAATEVSTVDIAAESEFPGHDPIMPKLVYLQRDPSIQSLVALRMDSASPLSHQKYTLRLSTSCGIKEKDAVKIDAALKAMKITGNTTVTSEAQKETRKFFEYEIDF